MPIYTLEVQSYRAGVTLESSSFGFVQLMPPPDYHGGVQPVNIYCFENVAFSAYVIGNNPYNYNYYVVTPNQTLYNSILELLERSGPKHVSLYLESDIPISGSFDIAIDWFGIGTDSLSAQFALGRQQVIPEKLRKLLPVQKTV
jgi:hypothetical protein